MQNSHSGNWHRVERAGRLLEVAPAGTFSYLSADGKMGWKGLGFDAVVEGTKRRPRLSSVTPDEEGRQFALLFEYPDLPLSERVTIRMLAEPAALTVERVFVNNGADAVNVHEVRTVPSGRGGGVLFGRAGAAGLRCLHVSNLRESYRMVGRSTGPFVCPLPYHTRTIGDSEGHPFPALAIADRRLRSFLLEAALQQDVFTQMWEIKGAFGSRRSASIYSRYAGIARDGRKQPARIEGGAERRLSALFYQIKTGCPLADLYDDYLEVLNRHCDLRGKTSPLLEHGLYCTWNYTFFADISAEIIRTQAAFLARHLKGVRYFLIDDGYQRSGNVPTYDMGKFYPDPDRNIDPVRFPGGMKAVAETICSFGLKPAIWWTPAMGRDNDLVREHPEWLCLNDRGGSWSMDSGPARKAALDFSVKPAREFVEFLLETIFEKWGYVGMKLDFCTYPFDLKDIRLRHGEGVHWWNWFLETIARFIPDDGFFQLCGGAPYGNPFIARHCDNHRIGGDIGHGLWRQHHAVSRAPLPLLAVPGRSTMLMDVDSAGVRQDMTDDENLSRLNFCHVTQGVMGIGGDLTALSAKQVEWLNRITQSCDRGHKVYCPDRRAFTGDPLPEVLYVDYPDDGPAGRRGVRKEVAFFNWSDHARTIGYSLEELGISQGEPIVDFWTGEAALPEGGQLVARLNRRASRLMQVKRR